MIPEAEAMHLPWVDGNAGGVAGIDMAPLQALCPRERLPPDFSSPPPAGPLVELEDELAAMLASPPERARPRSRAATRGAADPGRARAAAWRDPARERGRGSPTWSAPTGSARWPGTGRGSARCSRATCSTERAGSPTAAAGRAVRRHAPRGLLRRGTLQDRQVRLEGDRRPRRSAGCCSCRARSPGPGRGRVGVEPRVAALGGLSRRAGSATLWEPGAPGAGPGARARCSGCPPRHRARGAATRPRSTTELARGLGVSAGERVPAPVRAARGRAGARASRPADRCSTCARRRATSSSARPRPPP